MFLGRTENTRTEEQVKSGAWGEAEVPIAESENTISKLPHQNLSSYPIVVNSAQSYVMRILLPDQNRGHV